MDEKKDEPIVEEKPEFEKKLDEMRAENERMEKNIKELKELRAFNALSGKADAGRPSEKPAEITPQEYAKRAIRGELNDIKK